MAGSLLQLLGLGGAAPPATPPAAPTAPAPNPQVSGILQRAPQVPMTPAPAPTAAPADRFQAAVQAGLKKYPRLAQYPFVVTSNPTDKSGNSETFEPDDPNNPVKGKWNIEIRGEPYISHPEWDADLVGLEGLHALQGRDPKFQAWTEQLINSMTPYQQRQAQQRYDSEKKQFSNDPQYGFAHPPHHYLSRVHIPEMIRGRLFGSHFKQVYGKDYDPEGEWRFTPKQNQILNQIQSYVTSSDKPAGRQP